MPTTCDYCGILFMEAVCPSCGGGTRQATDDSPAEPEFDFGWGDYAVFLGILCLLVGGAIALVNATEPTPKRPSFAVTAESKFDVRTNDAAILRLDFGNPVSDRVRMIAAEEASKWPVGKRAEYVATLRNRLESLGLRVDYIATDVDENTKVREAKAALRQK